MALAAIAATWLSCSVSRPMRLHGLQVALGGVAGQQRRRPAERGGLVLRGQRLGQRALGLDAGWPGPGRRPGWPRSRPAARRRCRSAPGRTARPAARCSWRGWPAWRWTWAGVVGVGRLPVAGIACAASGAAIRAPSDEQGPSTVRLSRDTRVDATVGGTPSSTRPPTELAVGFGLGSCPTGHCVRGRDAGAPYCPDSPQKTWVPGSSYRVRVPRSAA